MQVKLYILLLLLFISCTPYRLITRNLANQDDYKKFPNLEIAASLNPFEFIDATNTADTLFVDATFKKKKKAIPLAGFLAARKNIAFLVVKNDSILFERYSQGYDAKSLVTSFSISKSFVSSLVGIAIDEGAIASTDEYITTYLPELASKAGFDKIRIHHLLNHTSGIKFKESYVNPFGSDIGRYYYGKDLNKSLKKLKIEEAPGLSFHYQSANTQLLSMVLTAATGKSLSTYFEEKLWSKIGTSQAALWSTYEKQSVEKAFCCINAVTRDFAKYGRLMANHGEWNGEQIIPTSWMEDALRLDRSNGSIWGYQHHWVMGLREYGDFMAQGLYNQYIYVMPKKDIIIVSFNAAHIPKTDWVGRFRQIVDQL